jgi:hypothetical protein
MALSRTLCELFGHTHAPSVPISIIDDFQSFDGFDRRLSGGLNMASRPTLPGKSYRAGGVGMPGGGAGPDARYC